MYSITETVHFKYVNLRLKLYAERKKGLNLNDILKRLRANLVIIKAHNIF